MTTRKVDALLRLIVTSGHVANLEQQYAAQAKRFEAIRNRAAPVVVTGFNLFPTPVEIAKRMIEEAKIEAGHTVLEPSAGTGRLLDAIPAHAKVTAVEVERDMSKLIYERYPTVSLLSRDFLTVKGIGPFDRVVMNPPFERGTDVKHIQHAFSLLKNGGRLVALCYNGAVQRSKLRPLCSSWEVLPDGSFRKEGTNASVCLVTMTKE